MGLSHPDERQAIVAAAALLVRTGVLSHSNHGNASVLLPDGQSMLLTSTSTLLGTAAEGLAVLGLDGSLQEGDLAPTSAEIAGMHAVVYRERSDVRAVIHTHSPAVSAYAMAHAPLPIHYEGLLRLGVAEDIPVAAWGPRGSRESVENIAGALREFPAAKAVLLANHGVLAFGPDAQTAAQLIIAMEEAAELMQLAQPLGGSRPFPPGALQQVRDRMRQFAST